MSTDTTTAKPAGKIVLGQNQYGKAEVRVVRVTRDTERHAIEDLNVTSQLHGDFLSAHTEGNNEHVVPTDTQKNTVYAFAREGVGSPEELLLRLADHFTGEFDWVSGGRWAAEQYGWDRINDHNHSFVRNNREVRTAVVYADGDDRTVVSGVQDLTVLKSTASGFEGYPKDKYTTLQETNDRIMSTDVKARWRYTTTDVDFNGVYESVTGILLDKFSEKYSSALQQTMFEMGQAVLEAHPEIAEIKLSLPNNHHFVIDLSFCGLDNPNVVFHADDRPYGFIEATIRREDADDATKVWETIPGFC